MEDIFSIGLIQCACSDDTAQNVQNAEAHIREAAKRGAQVICLQELFSSRYFCTTEITDLFSLSETIPGPTVSKMQMLAEELSVVIIVPVFEKRGSGVYHNSAAVVDADGTLVGVYRKMHIPDDPLYYEKFYFAPGDADSLSGGYRIFATRYAKLGLLICWDQWYPEAARITSLLGAEVLFYPTAIGWHPAEKEQYGANQLSAWQTIQRAHAIANGIYVAAVNRVAHEPTTGTDGIEFFGHSFVSDPFGVVLAEASDNAPETLVVQCSRRQIEQARRLWPFLRDRRIDSYASITKRWLSQ